MNDVHARGPTIIGGFREVAELFDAVLVDQWGVLHDGRQVFPAARECLKRLRAEGKRVAVLSNSGKRAAANIQRLAALGLPPSAYDLLVSSGEVAWQGLLRRQSLPYAELGRRCFLLSRGGDLSAITGLDLERVTDPREADFLFLAGIDDELSDPEAWRASFTEAARKCMPMLCSNPDLVMFGAKGLVPAPGALATFYRSVGGRVHYVGKPHPLIFEAALAALGRLSSERVFVVGDSLEHDVLGGNRLGAGTVLVVGGVHEVELGSASSPAELSERILAKAMSPDHVPGWAVSRLVW